MQSHSSEIKKFRVVISGFIMSLCVNVSDACIISLKSCTAMKMKIYNNNSLPKEQSGSLLFSFLAIK